MSDQDWTTVVLRGNKKSSAAAMAKPAISPALKTHRMLEESDGPIKIKKLSSEARGNIVKKRMELSLNQLQLNTLCAFPQHTIKAFEAGSCHPTPAQLSILNRVLKLALKYE